MGRAERADSAAETSPNRPGRRCSAIRAAGKRWVRIAKQVLNFFFDNIDFFYFKNKVFQKILRSSQSSGFGAGRRDSAADQFSRNRLRHQLEFVN